MDSGEEESPRKQSGGVPAGDYQLEVGAIGKGEVEVGAVVVVEVVGQVDGGEQLGVDLQGGEGVPAGDGLGKGLYISRSTPSSCSFLRYLLATTRPKLSLLIFVH